MQTTIYNAGIYIRLSRGDERAGESMSIENQKEMLSRYVYEQGWNLVSTDTVTTILRSTRWNC